MLRDSFFNVDAFTVGSRNSIASLPFDQDQKSRLSLNNGRLYGRDDVLEQLSAACDRVAKRDTSSTREVVLVHGESGTGKSAVVEKSLENARIKRSYEVFMVRGKFDQNKISGRPYSAIVDAVTQLCNLISESEQVDEFRSALSNMNTVDDISIIVPPIATLAGRSTNGSSKKKQQNTYSHKLLLDSFRALFKTVCKMIPIILFIDDLQWADEGSQQLISILTSDLTITNLLVVGAYRDEEIDNKWINRLKPDGLKTSNICTDIQLIAWDLETINEVISDLTEHEADDTIELARLILRKTAGNPHFVLQYVDSLQIQGLLKYSFGLCRYEWDISVIESETDASSNVVTLLTHKLESLPSSVRRVLMFASCLGFVFNTSYLERLLSSNLVDEAENQARSISEDEEKMSFNGCLEYAVTEDFIERNGEARMKFSHDQVQEAAKNIFPSGENGDKLLICVGRLLIHWSEEADDGAEIDLMFFAGIDILYKRMETLRKMDSPKSLAELFLRGGKRAKAQAAFLPSYQYLREAITMLECLNGWVDHYDLCLEVHVLAIEVGRTIDDQDTLHLVDIVAHNSRCWQDKMRALSVKAYILGGRHRLKEAIVVCRVILKDLGIKIQRTPTIVTVLLEYGGTKRLQKRRKPEDMVLLPNMSNDKCLRQLEALHAMAIFAWHGDMELLASLVFLRMAKLTMKNGLCKHSPFAFATYGMLLAALGNLNEGYEFGQMALRLIDQIDGAEQCRAATVVVVESCLSHLKKPLYDSLAPLLEAHHTGMQTGEIEFASMCLSGHSGATLQLGVPLATVEEALLDHVRFYRQFGQGMAEGLAGPWLQFAINLQGKVQDPLVLTGTEFDEIAFAKTSLEHGHIMAHRMLHLAKMMLSYLLGDLEVADKCRMIFEKGNAEGTHFMSYYSVLFGGLTLLDMYRRDPKSKSRYLSQVRKKIKLMEKRARSGGVNATLIVHFLRAEKLSQKGNLREVQAAYDTTISIAARSGCRLLHAIALERAGYFMLSNGDPAQSIQYLQQARSKYADYGAIAKVNLMDTHFNWLSMDCAPPSIVGRTSSQLQVKIASSSSLTQNSFSTLRRGQDNTSGRLNRQISDRYN